jgi:rfaE bifunctional protein nucleotidyltransferase chain/domain/rfaE bifunctional protein kinase chain/domain
VALVSRGGRPLVVVGDSLLDRDLDGRVDRLSPEGPVPIVEDPRRHDRPGGAALAAALAAGDGGGEVVLVTAIAADEQGALLRGLLAAAGVEVIDLGLDGATPEKVRVRCDGRTLLRIDRGGNAGQPGPLNGRARRAISRAGGVLVADYGRGVAADGAIRAELAGLPAGVPLVWDPHPNGPAPVPGARLATPNESESRRLVPDAGRLREGLAAPADRGLAAVTERGRILRDRWRAAAVAITLGERGALLVEGEVPPRMMPARPVPGPDACGAGDRFAASAARLLADGALPSEAVGGAVAAASAFVAAGGPYGPYGVRGDAGGGRRPPVAGIRGGSAAAVAAAVRSAGGTVVATGGCFDLLHAGHVATLRAAAALGDCLVVCLNSDRSVRRLKGPGRPLVPERDRAAVLSALSCVDAVVIFDEPTPREALASLRPDVFAKGGDYALSDLPEAELLASWGGQAVILPYLSGRSTTRILQEANQHGHGHRRA